jgi:hypothetical protein
MKYQALNIMLQGGMQKKENTSDTNFYKVYLIKKSQSYKILANN